MLLCNEGFKLLRIAHGKGTPKNAGEHIRCALNKASVQWDPTQCPCSVFMYKYIDWA